MPRLDATALAAPFQEKVKDYQKIFGLRMANGFKSSSDFVSVPVDQKFTLTREILGNVTQPGRTGNLNFNTNTVIQWKQRIAELKPAKVDLLIGELELAALRVSFLANKQPADPSDINSLAGRDYIMGQVMKKIWSEVNLAVFRGQLGLGYDGTNAGTIASSMFQGGLNLLDGFGLKFTQGYATSGTGWVGDIPSTNKATSPATITSSNILAELENMVDMVTSQTHLEEFLFNDDPETPEYKIFMPSTYYVAMAKALDALTYKTDKLVFKDTDGRYKFKHCPNIAIEQKRWLTGVDNMFGSPVDNLFYLHQDTESDIPMMKFQEDGRALRILIDWELAFDYADGRVVTLYK